MRTYLLSVPYTSGATAPSGLFTPSRWCQNRLNLKGVAINRLR